jgi:predicted amidohydrolase
MSSTKNTIRMLRIAAGRMESQDGGSELVLMPKFWSRGYWETGSFVIQTSLGKIGVGICFDTHTVQIARLMIKQAIDLMLIPHSRSIPSVPTNDVGEQDIARMKNNQRTMIPYNSRPLGTPAASVNQCAPARAPRPEGYYFPGRATILDSEGVIRARLEEQKGVFSSFVRLDPSCKPHRVPRADGRSI